MKNILVFGDSNTWGYDVTTYQAETGDAQRMRFDERWPGRVQILLGEEYHIIENALNARTSMREDPYFPRRLGMDSLLVALDANAPLDLVIIQLGCNELKHFFNLTAGMIAYGVEQLVKACKVSYYRYPAPEVLLVVPAPTRPDIDEMIYGFSFGPDAYRKSLRLGDEYRAVARRYGCGLIDCAALDFELNSIDGLHYAKGDHAKLAVAVAGKVKEMLS